MNLAPTFEHYFPQGSEGPGTGALQGQCAVFCEYFVSMPAVGDTVLSKTTAVQQHGIMADTPNFQIEIGDAIVFNIGAAGHVALVNNKVDTTLTLSESNYLLPLHVDHTRQIQVNDAAIIGVLRFPLKVPIIQFPMNVQIKILNNDAVDTMTAEEIQDIEQTSIAWSGGALAFIATMLNTTIKNIPYTTVGNAAADSENPNGLTVTAIDFVWLRQLTSYLAAGFDIAFFWIADADWKGNVNGVEHFDAGVLPATCQCHEQDATEALNLQSTGHTEAFWIAMHEARHALCAIGGIVDDTHAWLAKGATGLQDSYAQTNLNYDAIQTALVALRATQPSPQPIVYSTPTNFPNWDTEAFNVDVKAAIVANASGAKNIIYDGQVVAVGQ